MVPVKARTAGFGRGLATVVLCLSIAGFATSGAAIAAPPADKAAAEKPVTVNGTKARTRFVIGLEKKSDFQVSSLQNPNRVVVDLADVKISLPTLSGDQPSGLVKSFRSGLASAGKVRIVIDVTDPVIVETATFDAGKDGKNPRLVLEFVPADTKSEAQKSAAIKKSLTNVAVANVGLASVQPPMPKPAERPEARAARAFKPVIVLDPGHGGQDSGANRNGAMEKEVVLAFGLTLRDKLNATGRYKVLMTRDNDRFVPLDDRRAFGEDNKAALFIAIHADYAGASASGATIYSLRESVANALKRSTRASLTDKELKAADPSDANNVTNILSDFADRDVQSNKSRTSLFARSVITYMGETTTMMSNPDREAAFRVINTTKMPSVLIELAYVSNKQDAAKLKSDQWRNKVADSIVEAIENYFTTNLIAKIPM